MHSNVTSIIVKTAFFKKATETGTLPFLQNK